MKRRLRVANKRRFITVVSALIFILGVLISSAAMMLVSSAEPPVAWKEIRVEQGDTLWAIADRLSSDAEDIRMKVHTIIEANNLEGGMIFPGQTLKVPVTLPQGTYTLQAANY